MEWIINFIKRLVANLVAFVAICVVILFAPLVSIWAVVAMEYNPRYGDLCGWFLVACPFCVGIWYMFIASITRYARAKHFGVSPRSTFLWAGARLFGGWFVSQALMVGIVLVGVAVFGNADGSMADTAQRVRAVAPVLLFAAWSPVLVNLTRHFMRRYPVSGTSVPCPVVGQ